jgi:uncharacterized membrane protein
MALPLFAFAKYMVAKTREGASAYMDILGFREFLNRAEKDRLERMGDKDLFSKFLPYAIALDVAENWAKAFEGIYQEAPDWYSSPGSPGGLRTFSPYGFSHSIQSVTSNLSSAVFSAPRGSGISDGGGGGGGGSSGGGSGGGGGGSW